MMAHSLLLAGRHNDGTPRHDLETDSFALVK
jgi:hypothetical protein